MIDEIILGSDEYVTMSHAAQALYPQLVLAADNFGLVSGVTKILRSIDAGPEALEELVGAGFVMHCDSGVYVLRHWMISNGRFKNDRIYPTAFPRELAQLVLLEDLTYGFQTDSKWIPQYHSQLQRIINIINKSLGTTTLTSDARARTREDTDGNDDNNDTSPIVYTNKQTGEEQTLREYLATLPWATGATWERIQPFREQMDDSLIRFAIDQTASMGADAPEQYLKTVLYSYMQAGFTTEEDAKRHEKWRSEKLS